MQIIDHGLEFAGVTASDAAGEDQGEFVGLTNAAIGVEEPLLKSIDGSATTEDQIVTEFYLCEKQSVLNPGVLSLLGGEKDRKSTRLNSSHSQISYAVFCLEKKKM